MSNLREAAEAALEALEEACEIVGAAWAWRDEKGKPSITALRAALAEDALQRLTDVQQEMEAQQEPFCYHDGRNIVGKEFAQDCDVFPLYTAPPQRLPLTDREIGEVAIKSQDGISPHDDTLRFARAIEAAHGIKGEA